MIHHVGSLVAQMVHRLAVLGWKLHRKGLRLSRGAALVQCLALAVSGAIASSLQSHGRGER